MAPAHIGASFRAFAVAIVVLAFALIASAPAQALVSGHTYAYSFGDGLGSENGQFGSSSGIFAMGVAVDQSNGDIYVADPFNSRIQKFDTSGNFLQAWGYGVANGANESQVCNAPAACQAGIPGAAPGQFEHPTSIAVDNSGGESDGAVYVADTSTPVGGSGNYVLKFTRNGAYVGKIDGSNTPGGPFNSLTYRQAIAVDGNGFLWVADGGRIVKFTGESENEYVGGSELAKFGSITSIATNAAGTRLFVIAGYAGVFRLSANGLSQDEIFPGNSGESVFAIGEAPWIGVDPVTEHAYVAYDNQVREYGLDNQQAAPIFGPGRISVSGGLAFDDNTGVVYVADVGTGNVLAFEPRAVPTVETKDATDIGTDGATLNGEVAPEPAGGGDVTDCHFEIGTDTSYGTSLPCDQATPYTGPRTVSAEVSGLPMEATYHYRLVASNSIDANPGEDRTFAVHAVLGIKTEPATQQTPSSVTLNGSFDPAGRDTHYYFEWGTDTSYGNVTVAAPGVDAGSADGVAHFSAPIGSLSSYAKYHYRIVATNNLGTSYGDDEVAVTAPPDLPTISGTFAGPVTDVRATVGAAINPNLGDTFYGFEYGPTTSYGLETLPSETIAADDSDHPVTTELSGLRPGTTYHLRALAVNFGGTTHGPDLTFTTQDAPKVESTDASSVTQTTATLDARINPSLSATSYRFEFGPSSSYGESTPSSPVIGADNVAHSASATISGLAPGTIYHYRAVAGNTIGTMSSVDQTFTTAPPSAKRGTAPPAHKCRKGFVRRRGRCVRRRHAKHRNRRGDTE